MSTVWAQEGTNNPLPFIAGISGSYRGVAPCDDCKRIETELELSYDTDSTGHFNLRNKYVGNGGSDMASRISGAWMVEQAKNELRTAVYIVLNFETPDKVIYYLRQQNGNLLPLDNERKPITAATDLSLNKE